jgi:hypothetical protein
MPGPDRECGAGAVRAQCRRLSEVPQMVRTLRGLRNQHYEVFHERLTERDGAPGCERSPTHARRTFAAVTCRLRWQRTSSPPDGSPSSPTGEGQTSSPRRDPTRGRRRLRGRHPGMRHGDDRRRRPRHGLHRNLSRGRGQRQLPPGRHSVGLLVRAAGAATGRRSGQRRDLRRRPDGDPARVAGGRAPAVGGGRGQRRDIPTDRGPRPGRLGAGGRACRGPARPRAGHHEQPRDRRIRLDRLRDTRRRPGRIGPRTWRVGCARSIRVLERATMSVLADRRRHAPQGVEGGQPGGVGRNEVDGKELPAKASRELAAGALITIHTPGRGRLGSPARGGRDRLGDVNAACRQSSYRPVCGSAPTGRSQHIVSARQAGKSPWQSSSSARCGRLGQVEHSGRCGSPPAVPILEPQRSWVGRRNSCTASSTNVAVSSQVRR